MPREPATLARIAPGSPVAGLESARVLMASNDFSGAAVELRRIVTSTPQFTHARFLLGISLAAQGNLAQANQDRVAALERSQHARRVGDRRERVAQLVREHRQELALAPLGQAQALVAELAAAEVPAEDDKKEPKKG